MAPGELNTAKWTAQNSGRKPSNENKNTVMRLLKENGDSIDIQINENGSAERRQLA